MGITSDLFGAFFSDAELTEFLVERLMGALSVPEGILWLVIPACLQWSFLLRHRRSALCWLLLAPLAPIFVLFSLLVILLGCGFLIGSLFAGELLVLQFLEALAWMGGSMLARAGLLAVGWGLGWALYHVSVRKGDAA